MISLAFFSFSSPTADDVVFFAACFSFTVFCALVGAAIKEPITRLRDDIPYSDYSVPNVSFILGNVICRFRKWWMFWSVWTIWLGWT